MDLSKLGNIFLDQSVIDKKNAESSSVTTPDAESTPAMVSTPTPVAVSTFNPPVAPTVDLSCEPHMQAILAQYEKGFDSLNLPGYDFFEFFNAVMLTDPNNPQVYEMAFTMGKSMDPTLTKEKLIKDGQYYLDELCKVHNTFKGEGQLALDKILEKKRLAGSELSTRIESLSAQIDNLTRELNTAKTEAQSLDTTFQPQITEIECKLKANDIAKDTLVNKINLVKNNIK